MKIDRLQIKLIIGLIFIAILYVVVLIIGPKENNEIMLNNTIGNEISPINYPANNIENINNAEMQNTSSEEIKPITKEDLLLLIEKADSSSDYAELFMYSTEFFENNQLANIFYEGNYSDIIDYVDLNQYKEENVEFITLRNTDSYIWGYFFENDKTKEKTYIIVDKLSGKLKSLNNASIQVIIY